MSNNPHQNLQGPLADNNNTNFMGTGVPPASSGPLSFQFQDGQIPFVPLGFSGLPYHPPGLGAPDPTMYPPPPPQLNHPVKNETNYHPRAPFHPYEYNHNHNQMPYQVEDHQRRPSDIQQEPKRPRITHRHPSDEDEREAGLALAGLGLSSTTQPTRLQSVPESETSQGPSKKQRAKAVPVKKERGSEPGKGQNACKECRRLKAKCDKQIPCSTCIGRGCAGICPDGSMAKMQGKRLVISGTTELHERIAKLEAALASTHSQLSSSTHPLLGPEHLDGGSSSISPPYRAPALSHSDSSPDTHPSSLRVVTPVTSITEHGSHPRMAVESLLLSDDIASEGRKDAEWVGENAAPAFIIGTAMPAEPEAREKILHKLLDLHSVLPPREETQRRAKRYFASCQWFTNIIRSNEFENTYEPAVYEPSVANPLSPHKLACVLMVLTLETFLDITGDEDDPAITKYWEAAQQCFDTRFGWAASVAGIQALALATYFVTFGWRGARASNYYWLRQSTSAILQLGLHKDPHSALPLVEQDLRRRVFWEALSMDALLSINHGQRPAIYFDTVETIEPTDACEIQKTKFKYMREVKLPVLDVGCRPDSAPASQEHLQATLDKVKRFDPACIPHLHCPVLLGEPMPAQTTDMTKMDIKQIHLAMSSMCHYKAFMFLVRPSLRRLISRIRTACPEPIVFDDMDRQVVTATFEACRSITLISKYMTRTHPRLAVRLWSTWVQTFSGAVSMAALAIWCGTYMDPNFIPAAYQELCDACDLICENRSHRSGNVETLLPILQSIVADRYPYLVSRSGPPQVQPDKEDMLFALLGGRLDKSTLPPQAQSQNALIPQPIEQFQDQNQNPDNQFHLHPQFWQVQPNFAPTIPQFGQPDPAFGEFDPASISAMELWNRFQSFYEPTPVSWGAAMGGQAQVPGGINGLYDGMFVGQIQQPHQ